MAAGTTGKMVAAVLLNSVVRHRTAKIALSWDNRIMHVNEKTHGKGATERTAKSHARQCRTRAHGKEEPHGKGRSQRTAKTSATAKAHTSAVHGYYAVRHGVLHGKGAFAVLAALCRAHTSFFKKNHF
jgi:hypothetical protein